MADSHPKQFDFETVEIGEELRSYEYVLSQEVLDKFRASVEDPDAPFPTIAVKHDATAFRMSYQDDIGEVTARNDVEFHNPPIAGKKITVTSRIADKYWRRGKPYLVTEATAFDEDGRLLERMRSYEMKDPDEAKKKWQPQI